MAKLNPDHVSAVMAAINRGPFFRLLSMRVVELGPGFATVEMRLSKKHKNPFGSLHGASYAAAIDTATYWAAYCDLPAGLGHTTIDLKVDLLAPASGRKIMAAARTIRAGKTIMLAEATLTDAAGTVLAHGTSKLMVTRRQTMADVMKYLGLRRLPKKFL